MRAWHSWLARLPYKQQVLGSSPSARTILKIEGDKNMKKQKENLKFYAPWVIFYRQIETLFARDPEVRVEFNEATDEIKLYVENEEKAYALSQIMPKSKSFGNIIISISIVPSNEDVYKAEFYKKAFEGNDAFAHLTTIETIPGMEMSNPISYCVFKKEVVQYAADDLGSESGLSSTLYQDLAKEIFKETDGVYFCTDSN